MTDEAEFDDQDNEASEASGLRKQLKDAKTAQKAAEERANANEAAARRVAFQDAGIPDSPQAKFFREHYQGDLSSEAILAAAVENGFAPEQSAETRAEIDELEAQAQATLGAEPPLVSGSDAEMLIEMERAASGAPKGMTAQAIEEVRQKYSRSVG